MSFSKKSLEKLFDQQINRLKDVQQSVNNWVYASHKISVLEQMKQVVIEKALSADKSAETRTVPFVPVITREGWSHSNLASGVRSKSCNPFAKGDPGDSDLRDADVKDVITLPVTSTYYMLGVELWDLGENGFYRVFNRDGDYQDPERCCTTAEIVAIGIHAKLSNADILLAFGSECSRDDAGVWVPALHMNFEKKGPHLHAHHVSRNFFHGLSGSVPHCRERISL